MGANFKDYFSTASGDYQVYRPGYPRELFHYLSSLTPGHERAWDCATGNGQTALSLAEEYSEVIATDASQNQVSHAPSRAGVIYRVEPAEQTSLTNQSVDLVTVAQALHWFNISEFTREVSRVLKHKGVLAVWSYGLLKITPEIDSEIHALYDNDLEPYWPPERKMVEEGYRDIQFPLEEIQAPVFQMEMEWTLSQLVGYLCTWSAVKNYQAAMGIDPVESRYENLARLWGNPEHTLQTVWPMTLQIWRNN